MRSRDGDAVFQACQFRQHLGASNDRDLSALCRKDLWIVQPDGRRRHNNVSRSDVLGGVRVEDRRALAA